MEEKLFNVFILFFCFLSIASIDVSNVEELHKALAKARAGQTISIAPGEYDYTEYESYNSYELYSSGTESSPITLTAQDPDDPPILRGPVAKEGVVLRIRGSYWIIDNIKVANGGRGILIENSSYNIIRNVEIYNIGSKAVQIRDGATHNLFQKCYIHNTGCVNNLFGEAFDIGRAFSETTHYIYVSDYNVIERCIFRQISSVPFNIREFTTGNEIVNNIFYGEGINGKNGANTFMTIAGSDNSIHGNVFYRNENRNIASGFEIKKLVEESGDGNEFVDNILFMDRPYGEIDTKKRMYIVDGENTKFSVKNNKVDYGNGLIDAESEEFYNSDSVTYLE
jgi:hypothetical protein